MTTRLSFAIAGTLLLAPALAAADDSAPVVVVNPSTPQPSTPPVVVVNPTSDPAQPNDNAVDLWNAPVFGTGAVVFGGTYLASVIVADSSNHQGDSHLYVPIVGPWLDLADRGPSCPALQAGCDNETTAKVLLAADGVFQAAGVLTMLDGVLSPSRHTRVVTTAKRDYHVTPTTVHGDPGIAVFGHF